ncbi:hypothetical protein CYMTET_29398, partial [Cymbomonas tetramitiformis]
GGAYTPDQGAGAQAPKKHTEVYVPHRVGALLFDSAKYEGMAAKLGEFNGALSGTPNALSDQESAALQGLFTSLQSSTGPPSGALSPEGLAVVVKMLAWPAAQLFPVLDLARMLVLNPAAAQSLTGDGAAALRTAITTAAAPPAANQLTALRFLANCASQDASQHWLLANRPEVLDMFTECSSSSNKNVRLALGNLLVNIAVMTKQAADSEGKVQCLSAAVQLLESVDTDDVEAIFRGFVAAGTAMHADAQLLELGRDMGLADKARAFASCPTAKVADCSKEILAILGA